LERSGKLTERSYYEPILRLLSSYGASSIAEVCYNSQPDIICQIEGQEWLIPVRIGTGKTVLKNAFVQYLRHVADTGCKNALLLFLPDEAKSAAPETSPDDILSKYRATGIVNTPYYNDLRSDLPVTGIIRWLCEEVVPRVRQGSQKSYELEFVVTALKEHVQDMIEEVSLDEPALMRLVVDPGLLAKLGGLASLSDRMAVARFFAAYVFLSQTIFFRLFTFGRPEFSQPAPVTRSSILQAFREILRIDYRPIFEMDVTSVLPEELLRDTFELVTGLRVEHIKHELPGRCFHALMPDGLRKKLASFYTRPYAADLLASLSMAISPAGPARAAAAVLATATRVSSERSSV